MQARPDVIRGIGIAAPLIPGDEGAAGDDARDTGQTDPLPDATHGAQSA